LHANASLVSGSFDLSDSAKPEAQTKSRPSRALNASAEDGGVLRSRRLFLSLRKLFWRKHHGRLYNYLRIGCGPRSESAVDRAKIRFPLRKRDTARFRESAPICAPAGLPFNSTAIIRAEPGRCRGVQPVLWRNLS